MNKQAEQERLIAGLLAEIQKLAADLAERQPGRVYTLMEVCGTHTMSIYRYGLRRLLPSNIRLIAGPGCPVCVTPAGQVAEALALARLPQVILTSFGDMLRVPAGGDSLLGAKEQGADVRLVLSPLDALTIAQQNPHRQVVFLAVGFETTAPLTAATLQMAAEQGVANFSLLSVHKTMPQALAALFGEDSPVDGLLCPGHVAAVTGAAYFRFVPQQLSLAAAIAGFEPEEILLAVRCLLQQLLQKQPVLENCYRRAVTEQGNKVAMHLLQQVFQSCDAVWRGLGTIAASGLSIRSQWAAYDARCRFGETLAGALAEDPPGCRCGLILQGKLSPTDCPLFGGVCTPAHPQGACMVSAEGSCAAHYKYAESLSIILRILKRKQK